ncbi:hypothetical protein L218DRAFT_365820 [Marasmius fiardii PR-910]|nr:hypothetical protein L218DRAFT_365820 [Marasmius fiardii PR-910]
MLPKTPFSPFLNTNYAPSTQEIGQIQDLLLDPAEKLKKLDDEISRLHTQRDELQAFIDEHRALLSPFRRLPADIWSEIFIHCLPPSEFPVRSVAEAPLLLTRVCRLWRQIALKTPRLWNALHLNIPDRPPKVQFEQYIAIMRARLEGVKGWLQRAGFMPLRLSMSVGVSSRDRDWDWDSPIHDTDVAHAEELAVALLQYSRRWKSLSLNRVPRHVLQMLAGGDAPRLEKVTVVSPHLHFWGAGPDNQSNDFLTSVSDILEKWQAVHLLHMERIPEQILVSRPPHWARLTELGIISPISDPPCQFISKIAELCPSLVKCGLKFSHYRHDPAANPVAGQLFGPPRKWARLEKLDLDFLGYSSGRYGSLLLDDITNAFGAFTAPSLTELGVSLDDCDHLQGSIHALKGVSETPFHQFLLRSGCGTTLTRLSVDLPLRDDIFIDSLRLLTSLTSLRIGKFIRRGAGPNDVSTPLPPASPPINSRDPDPLINSRFLQTLTPDFDNGSSYVCPILKHLELSTPSSHTVYSLVKLARVRAEATSKTAKLESLRVNFGEQPKWVVDLLTCQSVQTELEEVRSKNVHVVWDWSVPKNYRIDNPHDGMITQSE